GPHPHPPRGRPCIASAGGAVFVEGVGVRGIWSGGRRGGGGDGPPPPPGRDPDGHPPPAHGRLGSPRHPARRPAHRRHPGDRLHRRRPGPRPRPRNRLRGLHLQALPGAAPDLRHPRAAGGGSGV
ncbi:MAG: hypothetical protein AVDCRST_MAG89-3336, partial [uncultured Gemmatimonadetes bacterium]